MQESPFDFIRISLLKVRVSHSIGNALEDRDFYLVLYILGSIGIGRYHLGIQHAGYVAWSRGIIGEELSHELRRCVHDLIKLKSWPGSSLNLLTGDHQLPLGEFIAG